MSRCQTVLYLKLNGWLLIKLCTINHEMFQVQRINSINESKPTKKVAYKTVDQNYCNQYTFEKQKNQNHGGLWNTWNDIRNH